jgi:ABC-type phosphate transport system substrate-binding protein
MRRTVALALVSFAVLGAPEARAQTRGAVAIVVNPSTAVDDLSLLELRNVFLGERQFWGDGSRIVLLVRAPVAYERDVVLNRIYRMDESQFRQYWIAKVFRAQVSSGPKIVYSNDMTRQLVAALPGAVGFIAAGDVAADMKVLRINGKLPGDPDYPLR